MSASSVSTEYSVFTSFSCNRLKIMKEIVNPRLAHRNLSFSCRNTISFFTKKIFSFKSIKTKKKINVFVFNFNVCLFPETHYTRKFSLVSRRVVCSRWPLILEWDANAYLILCFNLNCVHTKKNQSTLRNFRKINLQIERSELDDSSLRCALSRFFCFSNILSHEYML